jgi:phosphopantetheine--protein transferase-like protein
MNENIKEIVGQFVKKSPESITDNTVIDRSAVGSSVLFHRMFAKLADAGLIIRDYHGIKTFSDLLNHQASDKLPNLSFPDNYLNPAYSQRYGNEEEFSLAVGIDLENIDAMPIADDFRENSFYKQNFSSSEIAYCILQPNPYASFAGLFAAKEAITKTDNRLIELPFSQIEIQHDLRGKPFFKDYAISISHTETLAVSVALNNNVRKP